MKKQGIESTKLGMFVLGGIFLLILSLYMIGKNRGMFTDSFELKTRFKAVNGLISGNNVRYAGIEIGAVESVVFVNDSTIEVTMNIQTKMRNIIRRNAIISLGTDGLIGNRVVNISPGKGAAPLAQPADLLPSREEVSTDAMLQTLYKTNENVAFIAAELRQTVHHINSSTQLARLLDDVSLSNDLKASLAHLHETTAGTALLMSDVNRTFTKATKTEGTLSTLLTDTTMAKQIKQSVEQLKTVEKNAELLLNNLNHTVQTFDQNLNYQKGTVHTLLKDTAMAKSLQNTLGNIEEGTEGFKLNMEALKHNFLLRGYFKRMERKKK